ncbi:hypothetical protein OUZ56_003880 [Daphnia magna]|uniref:Uncharacterized protein n=1 Tax=Daphnia magna TaxID=35525 RepID=A0ABQ9YN77_9CRUS|nr:hypothetical protein OUZ56_003880 [Daphnia magna]
MEVAVNGTLAAFSSLYIATFSINKCERLQDRLASLDVMGHVPQTGSLLQSAAGKKNRIRLDPVGNEEQ